MFSHSLVHIAFLLSCFLAVVPRAGGAPAQMPTSNEIPLDMQCEIWSKLTIPEFRRLVQETPKLAECVHSYPSTTARIFLNTYETAGQALREALNANIGPTTVYRYLIESMGEEEEDLMLALVAASSSGRVDVVQRLLDKLPTPANLSIAPLEVAVRHRHIHVVRALLKFGIHKSQDPAKLSRILELAFESKEGISAQMVHLLLAPGIQFPRNSLALFRAATRGRLDLCQWLIEEHQFPITDIVLMASVQSNRLPVVRWFLEHANTRRKFQQTWFLMNEAAQQLDRPKVAHFLQHFK